MKLNALFRDRSCLTRFADVKSYDRAQGLHIVRSYG